MPSPSSASASLAGLFAALFAACSTAPVRVVSPADDVERDYADVAADLGGADVVVLGEIHDSQPVHDAHLALLQELYDVRPDLALSLEMFERDVQQVLTQYLLGDVSEKEFLAKARPWPNYAKAYRPLVEFAKERRIPVLAANAPRPLAKKVSEEGIAAVEHERDVARQTSAPKDEYWTAFQEAMKEHGGGSDAAKLERMYEAQCLKDDTMAETIVDHLTRQRTRGKDPLVVHLCGKFHSDRRLGTVARIVQRMPSLEVAVVSAEEVEDAGDRKYTASRDVADYVLVAPKTERKEAAASATAAAAAGKAKSASPHGDKSPHDAAPKSPHGAGQPSPHGAGAAGAAGAGAAGADDGEEKPRPGLGIMPDYGHSDPGVKIAEVREDGAADKAGIEPGDVLLKLDGEAVADVHAYMEILQELTVGQKVEIELLRGKETVKLAVTIGESRR